MERSMYAGAVRDAHVGAAVTAMGWVQSVRDMGGVIFIDLRDREGVLQVVLDARRLPPDDFHLAEVLRSEYVVAAEGRIALRDADTVNEKISTGRVELRAERLTLLSDALPPPFPVEDGATAREEVRLKYRFLDLRRPAMYRNLKFRHDVVRAAREYLEGDGFIEVETPMLTKSTPEGARDYLVPSRVHPGSFYALPQSPQIFKQLLMVGGIDKYYQVARCFRDEDLRADRQPEFTQIDVEMSFASQEKILATMVGLVRHAFSRVLDITLPAEAPRLTWKQAMDLYGSDKPDLRFEMPIVEMTDLMADCSFSVFRRAVEAGGVVRALNIKGGASLPRTAIETLTDKATGHGARGMAWIALREGGEVYSILTKYFEPAEIARIVDRAGAKPGDFILFCADKLNVVRRVLGGLRLDIADMLNLRRKGDYRLLLVTDFPQFEYSEEESRYVSAHHPFTMPYPEDIPMLRSDPAAVRAQAYDIVLNGVELGGGSIRIHRRDVQRTMFEALGLPDEEIERRFGFMLSALSYGTPPHGGFALGLDRLVMLMLGADSLRDVIAFPKIKDASCAMSGAPDVVDEKQLADLDIHTGSAPAQRKAAKAKAQGGIDVQNVARLARLKLTDAEAQAMARDMGAIVAFADQLKAIDTRDVPPTAHISPLSNVFRADTETSSLDLGAILAIAPSVREDCVYVPRVVE